MHSVFLPLDILSGLKETKTLHPLNICLLLQSGKPQRPEHRKKPVSGGVTVFGSWSEAKRRQGAQGKSRMIENLKGKEGSQWEVFESDSTSHNDCVVYP